MFAGVEGPLDQRAGGEDAGRAGALEVVAGDTGGAELAALLVLALHADLRRQAVRTPLEDVVAPVHDTRGHAVAVQEPVDHAVLGERDVRGLERRTGHHRLVLVGHHVGHRVDVGRETLAVGGPRPLVAREVLGRVVEVPRPPRPVPVGRPVDGELGAVHPDGPRHVSSLLVVVDAPAASQAAVGRAEDRHDRVDLPLVHGRERQSHHRAEVERAGHVGHRTWLQLEGVEIDAVIDLLTATVVAVPEKYLLPKEVHIGAVVEVHAAHQVVLGDHEAEPCALVPHRVVTALVDPVVIGVQHLVARRPAVLVELAQLGVGFRNFGHHDS